MQIRKHTMKKFLLGTTIMVSLAAAVTPVLANPTGGRVVGGSATVEGEKRSRGVVRCGFLSW